MAGIGNATKYGILIREGDALERLAKVNKIAFDKTGTLTYGKPTVIAVKSFNSNTSSENLLQLTAPAEVRSEHPLGKAIVSYFKESSNIILKASSEFDLLAGRGVKSIVADNLILAGNIELLS